MAHTVEVGSHWRLLNSTMGDVKSVAIHSLVEWLTSLAHILKTTPLPLYQTNYVRRFARGMYFDGKLLASCSQYGASLTPTSTILKVTRDIVSC